MAYHESGHATERWVVSAPIDSLVMFETDTAVAGHCYHGRSAFEGENMLDWSNEEMRIAVAGGLAQGSLRGFDRPTLAYLQGGFRHELPRVGAEWLQPLVVR